MPRGADRWREQANYDRSFSATLVAKSLAGDLAPLDGLVPTAPADAFVGWLPQEHERDAEDAYAQALDHWQASGSPDLDERLPPVLADLGLDVVLLDEPTNDLDLAGLERLEGFVRGHPPSAARCPVAHPPDSDRCAPPAAARE